MECYHWHKRMETCDLENTQLGQLKTGTFFIQYVSVLGADLYTHKIPITSLLKTKSFPAQVEKMPPKDKTNVRGKQKFK